MSIRRFSSFLLLFNAITSYSQVSYFSTTYENDFFTGTDDYYTQGIHFQLTLPGFNTLFLHPLLPLLLNSENTYGLSVVQDCFTPTSISSNIILKGDRPFAAYIYAGYFVVSQNEQKKENMTSEIDIGAMGPCAVCEQEQKYIHHVFPKNVQPEGWQYQMSNVTEINYSAKFEKGLLSSRYTDLLGFTGINAGTLYDNAVAGGEVIIGKMQSPFISHRAGQFQFYGFLRGSAEGVVYNATLEGGVFSHDIYVLSPSTIDNIVLQYSYGLCLSFAKVYMEYSLVFITPEFKGGESHGWGHLNFTVYF